MRQRKPQWKQEGTAQTCLLCNNKYCDKYKSLSVPETCELKHETYCTKEAHKQRHAPTRIFRNIQERDEWIAANGETDVPAQGTAVNG